jgi:DNA-binding SARP family transcriptional activator
MLGRTMARVDFKLLGPLELSKDGIPEVVPGKKLRALLAMLLVRRNHHLQVDWLVDQLWFDAAPEKARNRLHALVLRLRSLLEPGQGHREAQMLVTEPDGYLLRLRPDQVDADAFHELIAAAKKSQAENDSDRAFATVREALGLWRGDALEDFAAEPFAQQEAARLNWSYAAATELWLESGLSLGRHVDLVREFKDLVRDPLPEKLLEWLIRRLSGAGRLQDALVVCSEQQRTYVEKCDADLPPAIQELRETIAKYELPAMRPPPPSPPVAQDGNRMYRLAEAQALINLGIVYYRQGGNPNLKKAIAHYDRALAIYDELGARYGQAQALDNLAGAHEKRGELDTATEHWQQAFQMFKEVGAPETQRIWDKLDGVLRQRRGGAGQ